MSTNLNSKFSQTESLFRTTLAAGITSTQQTIIFNDIPGGATQFPNWFVIEPLSSNYEIIYVPDGSGTATQINVVRGINPNENTDVLSAAFCKAHPANVDVILAPMHRHWNDLVLVMQGENTTGHPNFRVGDGTDVSVSIFAEVAAADSPFLRYDINTHKWLISNDGNSTIDIAAGGSGLTRGLGVNLVASAITLDVRTSGGLRNNQGTGSQQADVDPAVVARLDTANTWTAQQTFDAATVALLTPPGLMMPYVGKTAPTGWLVCDGTAVSRATYASLAAIMLPTIATFAVSIAAPGVVTMVAHGLQTGDSIYITTTGSLPTGLVINTRYWVVKTGVDTFNLATSLANALSATVITTTGSQSGVHTAKGAAYGIGDGTTTFNVPDMRSNIPVGRDVSDAVYFGGLGETGGEKTHVLTVGELAAHTHAQNVYTVGATASKVALASGQTATPSNTVLPATDSTGSGTAHNNVQPFVTVNYIIKT